MYIDPAREEDLPFINEIYNQAVGELFCTAHLEPVDMGYRRCWFGAHPRDRYPVFVAREGPLVTGWISLGSYRLGRQALDHVAEVSYYVDANYRNRGIGMALMTHATEAARDRGLSVLVAILLDRNQASIGLLEKFGFQRWGTMPGIARIGTEVADHLYFGLKL